MNGADNSTEREHKSWTYEQKRLVLTTRLKYEPDFNEEVRVGKRKKSCSWTNILQEIRDADPTFPYSKLEVCRKFSNMFITYKRIKERNSESGRDATRWEFFDLFDSVYGFKHSVNAQREDLISTFGTTIKQEANSGEEQDLETQIQNLETPRKRARKPRGSNLGKGKKPREQLPETDRKSAEKSPDKPKKTRIKKVSKFREKRMSRDERRYRELLRIETERINVLLRIKDLLERMLQH